MCLAVPARILELLPDQWAMVEVGGIRSRVCLALIERAQPGDYVIVHAGFALTLLNVAEAERTLALFAEIAAQLALQPRAGGDALHS
jgi:hydrogenase expression/formation protein HypC